MPLSAKEIREKRAPLANRIKQLRDAIHAGEGGAALPAPRDFTAEERSEWDRVNKEYDGLTGQLAIAERGEAIEAEQGAPANDGLDPRERPYDGKKARRRGGAGAGAGAVTEEHRALALQGWCRGEGLSERHVEACRITGINPRRRRLDFNLYETSNHRALQRQFRTAHRDRAAAEARTMSGQSGPAGGYLVAPEALVRQLEINMLYYGGMRQVAETITTTSGERMSWPTADDTTNTGEQVGESVSVDNSGAGTNPAGFAKVFWDAYKFSSKAILVPYELLEDSAFELAGLLGDMLGERLGRITNTRYTTGTGNGQPKGIITCATSGYTAASATAIAADEVIRLEHSVDPAYRNDCGYMMHDSILLALRLLKDGQGRYLWQQGFSSGAPDTLNGRPITVNQDMASSVAASAKTILFGQFGRYKIRRVRQVRMYRLQERYRDTDRDGFIAFIREDGNLLQAGTMPVKYLTQAAS